jgi:endonuclease IV
MKYDFIQSIAFHPGMHKKYPKEDCHSRIIYKFSFYLYIKRKIERS